MKDIEKLGTICGKIISLGLSNDTEALEKATEELLQFLQQPENAADMPVNRLSASKERSFTGFLKFTNEEISRMPKLFRKYFRAEGCTVFYRKRVRGIRSCSYEARYRRHGYPISVSSTDLKQLKQRFIQALHEADLKEQIDSVPTTFHEFAMYYFEKYRKRTVKPITFENDMYRYKNHIRPIFESMQLKKITPAMCQHLLDNLTARGLEKTTDEVFTLLNKIFKMAIAHGLMERNPLAISIHERHESEHGKALTKDEERLLLEKTAGTRYQLLFAVALYTGMRPNEYKTAKIDGAFIVAVNSKRKTKKVEYKKIPITPMLAPYISGITELSFVRLEYMRNKMRAILPDHRLYDLRTTFYTRCEECGVAEVAKKRFVGHSLGKLGDTYTDLSDEFLLSEGKKLHY